MGLGSEVVESSIREKYSSNWYLLLLLGLWLFWHQFGTCWGLEHAQDTAVISSNIPTHMSAELQKCKSNRTLVIPQETAVSSPTLPPHQV